MGTTDAHKMEFPWESIFQIMTYSNVNEISPLVNQYLFRKRDLFNGWGYLGTSPSVQSLYIGSYGSPNRTFKGRLYSPLIYYQATNAFFANLSLKYMTLQDFNGIADNDPEQNIFRIDW